MAQDFDQERDEYLDIEEDGEIIKVARRDVFISYDHKAADRAALDVAQRIADALERCGYSVWWDRMLLTGDWGEQLVRHAKAARRIVSLETVRYHEPDRAWCRREFEIGLKEDKLARFRVDEGAEPPADLAERAASVMYFDVNLDDPRLGYEIAKKLDLPPREAPAAEKTEAADIAALPATHRLVGRIKELKDLRAAWDDQIVNVAVLHAIGGAGKSAILYRFAMDILGRGEASRVYGWSAYSQGSSENSNTDADGFISDALAFFGGDPEAHRDGHARARALAKLVAAERALLLIDGLEPLQSPPHVNGGRLKSKPVATLIKQLTALNKGLCVITSRQPLPELPEDPKVLVTPLARLSTGDGAALLLRSGVTGPLRRIKAAVDSVNGHALSVKLLGAYASSFEGGRIEAAEAFGFRPLEEIAGLSPDEETARFAEKSDKLVESYLKQLDQMPDAAGKGAPERAILSIVGLFDRPAEGPAVRALLTGAAIPGLTSELYQRFEIGEAGITERELSTGAVAKQWFWAKRRLRAFGLLGVEDPKDKDALDAHPIIRRYFKQRLKADEPEAYSEAHNRLYQHYANAAPDLPETLEAMQPLLHAIPHGVEARRVQEAWGEIYHRRVRHGADGYLVRKLGAFEAELSTLACFFDDPWRRARPELHEQDQSVAFNAAAFILRALGRLAEAVEPFEAGVQHDAEARRWIGAAQDAGNLSELLSVLGRVSEAIEAGARSVDYADRSDDLFQRLSKRAAQGDALHQAGRLGEALALFEKSEAMQAYDQPNLPKLYSMPGYKYCDLLLSLGRAEEALQRADWTREIYRQYGDQVGLLDQALNELLAARAEATFVSATPTRWSFWRGSKAPAAAAEKAAAARRSFDAAIGGLRRAGQDHELPRGLIARAGFLRRRAAEGEAGAAERMAEDLDEAEEIARFGGMRLFLADVELERARFAKDKRDRQALARHKAEAARLIEECGYGRRLPELQAL